MIVGKDKKEQENKCHSNKLLELLRRPTTKHHFYKRFWPLSYSIFL